MKSWPLMWGNVIVQQSGLGRLKHKLRTRKTAMPEFARWGAWRLLARQNKTLYGWNRAISVLLSTWTALLCHSTMGSYGHFVSVGQEQQERWEGNWRAGHLLCGGQVKMETRARAAGAGREGVGAEENCSFSLGLKFQLGFSNHRDLLPFQLVGWSPVSVLWWPTFGSCPNACKLLVWQILAIGSLFWCGSWMV